jgi:hypothetical protein
LQILKLFLHILKVPAPNETNTKARGEGNETNTKQRGGDFGVKKTNFFAIYHNVLEKNVIFACKYKPDNNHIRTIIARRHAAFDALRCWNSDGIHRLPVPPAEAGQRVCAAREDARQAAPVDGGVFRHHGGGASVVPAGEHDCR